eukprot:GEZU01004118.1.p1 GENE.GEZU01004118.1~~GEZU01004118.1.p1  ORF type:complete len:590 (+),score=254.02 GEZU01004118.1:430-2199(+)
MIFEILFFVALLIGVFFSVRFLLQKEPTQQTAVKKERKKPKKTTTAPAPAPDAEKKPKKQAAKKDVAPAQAPVAAKPTLAPAVEQKLKDKPQAEEVKNSAAASAPAPYAAQPKKGKKEEKQTATTPAAPAPVQAKPPTAEQKQKKQQPAAEAAPKQVEKSAPAEEPKKQPAASKPKPEKKQVAQVATAAPAKEVSAKATKKKAAKEAKKAEAAAAQDPDFLAEFTTVTRPKRKPRVEEEEKPAAEAQATEAPATAVATSIEGAAPTAEAAPAKKKAPKPTTDLTATFWDESARPEPVKREKKVEKEVKEAAKEEAASPTETKEGAESKKEKKEKKIRVGLKTVKETVKEETTKTAATQQPRGVVKLYRTAPSKAAPWLGAAPAVTETVVDKEEFPDLSEARKARPKPRYTYEEQAQPEEGNEEYVMVEHTDAETDELDTHKRHQDEEGPVFEISLQEPAEKRSRQLDETAEDDEEEVVPKALQGTTSTPKETSQATYQVRFKLTPPPNATGASIVGDLPELGKWQANASHPMTKNADDTFGLDLDFTTDASSFEYKYLIEPSQWESGPNRSVQLTKPGEPVIVNDTFRS